MTSGILAELVHIVIDPKRFEKPLSKTEALEWTGFWSDTVDVAMISTDIAAHRQWLVWLEQHRLGRERLPDTLIAATWWSAGIREVFPLNPTDFKIFGTFTPHGALSFQTYDGNGGTIV